VLVRSENSPISRYNANEMHDCMHPKLQVVGKRVRLLNTNTNNKRIVFDQLGFNQRKSCVVEKDKLCV